MSGALIIDRYAVYGVIAAGGMATVHYGRLVGQGGFSRTVAIKRLHPQFASDPALVGMMVDEARLVARIRHPNVVPTLDVVASGSEVLVVMEYVAGESLAQLHKAARAMQPMPVPIAAAIMADVLRGLQAAHDAKDEKGAPLGIVHRDVSPQNILVGADGQARILDFGVAKAAGRTQTTRSGVIKGKIAYMSPEQLQSGTVTLQTDLFAASIVLWELLTGQRLFLGANAGEVALKVLSGPIEPPSRVASSDALAPYDALLARGLARDPEERFSNARQMREALEACGPIAPPVIVADWVQNIAHEALTRRAQAVSDIECSEPTTGPAHDAPTAGAVSTSVPPAEDRTPPPRPGRTVSVLGMLVVLLGVTLLGVLLLRRQPPTVATAAAPSQQVQTATQADRAPSDAVPLPAPSGSPPPEEAAASPRAAAPTATARSYPRARPVATRPMPANRDTAPATSSATTSSPTAARECVPYTYDAQGMKHYNPACL